MLNFVDFVVKLKSHDKEKELQETMRKCVAEDFDKIGLPPSKTKGYFLCPDNFEKFYVQGYMMDDNFKEIEILALFNEKYFNLSRDEKSGI